MCVIELKKQLHLASCDGWYTIYEALYGNTWLISQLLTETLWLGFICQISSVIPNYIITDQFNSMNSSVSRILDHTDLSGQEKFAKCIRSFKV